MCARIEELWTLTIFGPGVKRFIGSVTLANFGVLVFLIRSIYVVEGFKLFPDDTWKMELCDYSFEMLLGFLYT